VPNVESNTCLVRVKDKNDALKVDVSNAVFTIHIPVVVASPNGGETWQGGTNHLITWDIQGTSLTFNLDYSVNGGTSWLPITTNLSTSVGSYNWLVYNNPSTNCLVRVRDAVTNCMQDISNNAFTITPAQPILTYPNGGEQFDWDDRVIITWNPATFYSSVRLEYSLDNGITWLLITSGVSNTGSFNFWAVPRNTNNQVLIKASNSANVSINDVSNAVFSILKPMNITSPNGGEILLGCNTYPVSLTKSTLTTGLVVVEYSINGGTTWSGIINFNNTSYGSTFTTNWLVPNGINSTQCLVRAYNNSFSVIADTSNTFFTIQPNNEITVTSPNGGEVIPALSNYPISWSNTVGASGLYDIEYSSNNGNIWTTLASGISGNTYNWTNIPNVPNATYLVRVLDNVNTCKKDTSNANFTVSAAQPLLTYPNGGEQFAWDEPITITWNAASFYSSVRLEYSLNNGVTWQLITSGTSNTGLYNNWIAPRSISNQVLIKASNNINVNSNDVSNAVFSILKPLNITAPNGGESLLGCDTYTVSINKTNNTSGIVNVEYSTNAGATWNTITSFNNTSISSPFTTSWVVPNGISSTQCLVRAYNSSFSTMADTSNAFFTIQPNNVITVTSPNGGEVIPSLTNYIITWTNTAGASGLYNVQYSSNNGSTWNTLASGISGNTYNWTNIPNVPTTTYLVRVQDNANTCKNDISNANFTISAAQPILTYPNGGEQFNWDEPIIITWNAATFYSPVRLEYSLDNGIIWQLINSGATNNGATNWTVPRNTGNQVLIKASNNANVNSNDVSNAVFNILKP
jgi:hypothetical protein